jgi:hypothetical protein
MFECERCGSSYSASHVGVEHCPRCRLRDRVEAPLVFRAFRLREGGVPARMATPPETGADVQPAAAADQILRQ